MQVDNLLQINQRKLQQINKKASEQFEQSLPKFNPNRKINYQSLENNNNKNLHMFPYQVPKQNTNKDSHQNSKISPIFVTNNSLLSILQKYCENREVPEKANQKINNTQDKEFEGINLRLRSRDYCGYKYSNLTPLSPKQKTMKLKRNQQKQTKKRNITQNFNEYYKNDIKKKRKLKTDSDNNKVSIEILERRNIKFFISKKYSLNNKLKDKLTSQINNDLQYDAKNSYSPESIRNPDLNSSEFQPINRSESQFQAYLMVKKQMMRLKQKKGYYKTPHSNRVQKYIKKIQTGRITEANESKVDNQNVIDSHIQAQNNLIKQIDISIDGKIKERCQKLIKPIPKGCELVEYKKTPQKHILKVNSQRKSMKYKQSKKMKKPTEDGDPIRGWTKYQFQKDCCVNNPEKIPVDNFNQISLSSSLNFSKNK